MQSQRASESRLGNHPLFSPPGHVAPSSSNIGWASYRCVQFVLTSQSGAGARKAEEGGKDTNVWSKDDLEWRSIRSVVIHNVSIQVSGCNRPHSINKAANNNRESNKCRRDALPRPMVLPGLSLRSLGLCERLRLPESSVPPFLPVLHHLTVNYKSEIIHLSFEWIRYCFKMIVIHHWWIFGPVGDPSTPQKWKKKKTTTRITEVLSPPRKSRDPTKGRSSGKTRRMPGQRVSTIAVTSETGEIMQDVRCEECTA